MNKMKKIFLIFGLLSLILYSYEIEKIISREHHFFNIENTSFTVGKDGNVYFFNPISGRWDGYILKVDLDGKIKTGYAVGYGGTCNATANSECIIAEASAHFRHTITIYDKNFKKLYEISDFLVNDNVGWDSPGHVESGESGDFYGLDQNRDRILRISPKGKIIKIYQIPKFERTKCYDFRVCENKEKFYLLYWGKGLVCIDFNGNIKWQSSSISPYFDVDSEGRIYSIRGDSNIVEIFSEDGSPLNKIKLDIEKSGIQLNQSYIRGLRIYKNEILIHRESKTELFERFNLESGNFIGKVEIDYEKIKVEFPQLTLFAGEEIPFKIDFYSKSDNKIVNPEFHIYIKPLEGFEYKELVLKDGKIFMPDNLTGIYLLLITPDLNPVFQENREYSIATVIQIIGRDKKGTVNILTDSNRVFYGKGEPISFKIKVKGEKKEQLKGKIKLFDENFKVINEEEIDIDETKTYLITGELTKILNKGAYLIKTDLPEYTNVGQIIFIGDKINAERDFYVINYGDYGLTFPRPLGDDNWSFIFYSPEKLYNHALRCEKLGINLLCDRIGFPTLFYALRWDGREIQRLDEIKKILSSSPLYVSEEKLNLLPPFSQLLSIYSAKNIKEMAILLGNDAGLPLGTGFDNRKSEEMLKTIEELTNKFLQFPSFRGWIWASNWWVFQDRGADAAKTPEGKERYNEALKKANENGYWDPILEKISDIRLGYGEEAIRIFNEKLEEINPDLKKAVACPYRNVESYPPITMRDVDECDLQAQWEQIPPPYYAPLNVDFYKRPNKKDLTHPEIWNDSGTGEQIFPTLFSMIMRGTESTGNSGPIPPWGNLKDKRTAHLGNLSIFRSFYNLMNEYGPWLSKLEKNDNVAILADGRMYRIDNWGNIMGIHFARVYEAYLTCLFSHQPASIVFSEDVRIDTFKKFKIVLIVDQRVEFEENVLKALKEAVKSGIKIYYDDTCNKEIVKEFIPLGIAFNKIEKDPSLASDDSAYWRVKNYIFSNLPSFKKIFDEVKPSVLFEEPEVFMSERKYKDGKFIFIVNYKNADIGPEYLWKVTLNVSTTLPLKIPLKFTDVKGKYIYDVFSMEEIKLNENGEIECDLKNVYGRIYAVLNQKIDKVEISGPREISKGSKIILNLRILDEKNIPLKTIIPIKIVMKCENGEKIFEENTFVGETGRKIEIFVPINLSSSGYSIVATELISGKKCEIKGILKEKNIASIFKKPDIEVKTPEFVKFDKIKDETFIPPSERFGPKIKDIAISYDREKILINTMDWDTNLYCVSLKDGKILWKKKIGSYFSFAPKSFVSGFCVEGYEFKSLEGYHYYYIDEEGNIKRKFALFGIPQRLCHRFVPGIVFDNIDQFEVNEKGEFIAVGGNFGIVVWDKNGKEIWKKEWWHNERKTALITFWKDNLVIGEGGDIYLLDLNKKEIIWQKKIIPEGKVKIIKSEGDLLSVYSETEKGGIIFVFNRNGNIMEKYYGSVDEFEVSKDNSFIVSIKDNVLKFYKIGEGLKWTYSGDDILESISISPDSKNIIFSSIIGNLYILDKNGNKVFENDFGEKVIGRWINNEEFVAGSWSGKIYKFKNFNPVFKTSLIPDDIKIPDLFTKEDIPVSRITEFGNASKNPFPINDNIFNSQNVIISFIGKNSPTSPNENHLEIYKKEIMIDGINNPPEIPYLKWTDISWMAETIPFTYLQFDAFNSKCKVKGITIYEDEKHPEFWLKDAIFEYWDDEKNSWVFVDYILSDLPIHTHIFKTPVESTKFRIVMPKGFYSNIKFGEICFHGEIIGCSHPDVQNKREIAILFDENDINYWREHFYPSDRIELGYKGAIKGEKFLIIKPGISGPVYRPPFGHRMRNWNFEIVENPQQGQYRYLQFYWKKISPNAKNVTIMFDGFAFYSGEYKGREWYKSMKLENEVPDEWKLERIDLYKFIGKNTKITTISFITDGEVAFDQIVLGKDEESLDKLLGGKK